MIQHAMTYVTMAQKVRAELGTHPLNCDLLDAEEMLLAAEQEMVRAYGLWRALMHVAAPESPLAAKYLKRTVWDLT